MARLFNQLINGTDSRVPSIRTHFSFPQFRKRPLLTILEKESITYKIREEYRKIHRKLLINVTFSSVT
uniref:Uncharacterized protein n=1 Tax=Megaselia scalaris TaxID=36166 RepID=T1GEW5_MEGSC